MNTRKIQLKVYLSMLLIFLPLLASAQTKVEIDGIWYNLITKAKQAEVTESGSSEYSGSITIPATVTYNGVAYSVTSIGHSAFYECSSLTAITIPESVKSIGSNAFNNCMNLTSATIPMNSILTSIGDQAFERCSSLTSITIPATVTFIGGFAFSGCNGLTSVHISDLEAWCNIEFYNDSFFIGNCNPLIFAKNLYLNGTLVTHLTIPSTVTHIKDYTFNGCNLTSVTIHKNVTSIGKHAFLGCTGELMVECNIPMALEDEVFGVKCGAFDGSGFSKITIGTGVTSIGSYAFSGCSKLTDINIPEGVTSIGAWAFYGCSSLTAINIPEGVTSIEAWAFYGCSNLTAITIPESVTSIGEGALFGCGTLTSIVLPKSIKYINSEAFANCLELTDVYCYADTVPSAGADVFRGSYIEYATLHVPASAINSYKATAPWSSFGTIVAMEESKPYLVTEGKQWAVCVTGTLLRPNQTTCTYRLQGDTIIDGKCYLIEYETNDMHLNGWIPSGHYMREEDGKVYRKYGRKKETILLDYNMQVGDTLRYNDRTDGMGNIIDDYYTYVCLVGVRDTILPNGDGVLRGCYDAVIGEYAQGEYHSTNWEATFVEDIGWLDTGLSDEIFFTSGCGKELLYVKQDNTMLYQKEKGVYWKGNHVNWRPLTKRGYGLYHRDSYLYAYTMDEAAGVTDSTDFARWNDRTVIRFDVDTIGYNAFSGATFRQGQIICFTERLNTILKDAFAGINIVPRSSQETAFTDDLTLIFEGANPPSIDKSHVMDYADSTCRINYAVPDIATYVASDIQWTYTTLMTIDDLLGGNISPENEVIVTDPTEVKVTDVEEGDSIDNSGPVVEVEARPRKDIPVRIGDGENKDIYSRAPAWQRYTIELKITDSSEAVLYEESMVCTDSSACMFNAALPYWPNDDIIYLHSRSIDMFGRTSEWTTQAVTLTRIEHVKEPAHDVYYDLMGRKVTNPVRGIYIKNGKKVIL